MASWVWALGGGGSVPGGGVATVRAHLGTVDASAIVYRRAVDRLPEVPTLEDAQRHLRAARSAILAFWQLACQMREPWSQFHLAKVLEDWLSVLRSRQAGGAILADSMGHAARILPGPWGSSPTAE